MPLRPVAVDQPPAEPTLAIEDRPDDELMFLARGGRRRAFDVLVLRHQRYVLSLTSKYLADRGLVRDVAQSAFVELYRFLPQYVPQGRFKQLLSRIVLNQCRMAGRANTTHRTALERFASETQFDASELPDDRIIAREQRHAVDRAVAQLGEKIKAVVVLRFSGGHSYREISDTLDVPIGTVKSRLAAGVEKLRQLVEERA